MFNISTDKDDRVQLSLKKPINTKRIMEHWDTIQRIEVTLAQRKSDQATLVRKLKDANGRAYNRTKHLPQRSEMMQ